MKHDCNNLLKFKKLQARLGMREWQVKGILQSIWHFTAINAIRGDIGRHSNEDIALGIDYDVELADELIAELLATGWLDEDSTHRLVVHDWGDHVPDYIRKRVERAKETFIKPDGRQRQTTADNGRQCPPTEQNRTEQKPSKPNNSCTALQSSSSAEEFDSSNLNHFPCVGKPNVWCLEQGKVQEYCQTYEQPEDAIRAILRQARQWLVDNPRKRKTHKGMPAFLTNWLTKEQNRGSMARGQPSRPQERPASPFDEAEMNKVPL